MPPKWYIKLVDFSGRDHNLSLQGPSRVTPTLQIEAEEEVTAATLRTQLYCIITEDSLQKANLGLDLCDRLLQIARDFQALLLAQQDDVFKSHHHNHQLLQ